MPNNFEGYGLDTVAYGNLFVTSFSPIVTVSAVLAPVAGLAYAGFFVTKIGVLKSVGAFAGSALVVNYPI